MYSWNTVVVRPCASVYEHDQDDAGDYGYQAMDFDNDDASDGSGSGDPGGSGDD